jgi:hypothetical protein
MIELDQYLANTLAEETIKNDKALRVQYIKELEDLQNHTGLAKTMSEEEIKYAKKRLIESINSLKYLDFVDAKQ